jgi:hypothetical protein
MDKRIWRMREEVAVALAGLVRELHGGADPVVDGPLGADDDVGDLGDSGRDLARVVVTPEGCAPQRLR